MTDSPTILVITSKTFSLKAQSWVHDDQATLLFDAQKTGVFSKDTQLNEISTSETTILKDQRWKPESPWLIESTLGQFQIKRNIRSITRHYWIEGGVFDGATVQADSPDYGYQIALGDRVIANAYEKRLSLKSEQQVDMVEDTAETRLLAAIVGIVVSREKQEQRNNMQPS